MQLKTFGDTPGLAALRIFGATGLLLALLLVAVHPQSLTAAMSSMIVMLN